MKKITLTLITLVGLACHAQVQLTNENFDSLQNYALPNGWNATFTDNYIGIDDYYTACSGTQYLYANIYESEITEITTSLYVSIIPGIATISYNLKIMDFDLETPFVGDFGTVEMLYTLNNGNTWHSALTTNSTNFTPSNNCQLLSYTIPTGSISSLDNLRVKFNFIYNSGDWEVIIDDFKIDIDDSATTPNLNLSNLSVYPNPVSDVLNVDYNENISNLTVYDLSGRSVKSFTTNNSNNSIDVSDLKSGIYMLRIETENKKVSTVKFIKK